MSRALPLRAFSSTPSPPLPQTTIYTGPFTGVTLRLKRVSIFSATVGSIGLPWLIYVTEKTAMAASAVGGTAMLAAVGSTLLLNYCTNPYVHSITKSSSDNTLTITQANMLGMRKQTSVCMDTQCIRPDQEKGTNLRPFCNFIGNGQPFYIHGEVFDDKKILKKLLGRKLTESEMVGRAGDKGRSR